MVVVRGAFYPLSAEEEVVGAGEVAEVDYCIIVVYQLHLA
jgi:hypothetical protein